MRAEIETASDTRVPFQDSFGLEDGCQVAEHCLDCPLPQCRYDDPQGFARFVLLQRDDKVATLHRQGRGTTYISRSLGISKRTVVRSLLRLRESTPFKLFKSGTAEYYRAYRQWKLMVGRCQDCSNPPVPGLRRCRKCLDLMAERRLGDGSGRRRAAVTAERQALGLCTRCGGHTDGHRYCSPCRQYYRERYYARLGRPAPAIPQRRSKPHGSVMVASH